MMDGSHSLARRGSLHFRSFLWPSCLARIIHERAVMQVRQQALEMALGWSAGSSTFALYGVAVRRQAAAASETVRGALLEGRDG